MEPTDFAFRHLDAALVAFGKAVPAPSKVKFRDGFVFRYVEKTGRQAIVLKTAHLISTLHAAKTLLSIGHGREVALLQRVLDEACDDIYFLAGPYIGGKKEDRHDQFLEYFWQEEFEESVPALESRSTRGMVSRDKILAYNARTLPGGDPSTNKQVSQIIAKAYSGYVHGAAPHILDMYGGDPPKFHTRGYAGTSRHQDHADDFANYPYRGLMAACVAAIPLGLTATKDTLYIAVQRYASATGL